MSNTEPLVCVYCNIVSDFPKGYCEQCNEYDGIVSESEADEGYGFSIGDDLDAYYEEMIDSYAEASLFGWDS